MATLKAVRGTRDLLPPETELWNRVEATARGVFARYGFGEIRTPMFEATELFARGVGEETDIVSKEMYTWEDGERFDDKAFSEAWTNVQLNEKKSVLEEAHLLTDKLRKLGVQRIIGRRNPEKPEFVCFRFKATSEAIETLNKAKLALQTDHDFKYSADADYFRRFGPGLRLVVPAGSPKPRFDTGEVEIEEFPGNFFKSAQSLTLRPENTAGVVRAYIEHKMADTGMLQKLFYVGPQFRRERPQRGRYRQFWQIGAEVIGPASSGSESAVRDAEVLEMLSALLDELGVKGWRLALNSVGSATDRPRYIAALREALEPVKAQMCEDNQRRAETNPLRVLDSKDPNDQEIINALPKIADYLDEDSREHFEQVKDALDACGVPYVVEPRLVRGLDYYTRTTFEFTVPDGSGLGTQNALLGGGRYDGLSEMLGGPKAPGIGFAIGEDRLILTLQAQAKEAVVTKLDAFIAPMGVGQNAAALLLAKELRAAGLTVEVGDGAFRLKKSFEVADKLARRIVIVGEDEVASGMFTVKFFGTGEQTKVLRGELAGVLGG
ncbi:histidine--tRNA ligase [Granulicella sp. dw_53]|uniref:histidine--tRNA ligase n=1 Tax=Granulicella sp. dw_53 TaxID=2719792 RepID=UPI002103F6A8|nr:histidine--tRNA ligase [Granulicella sp. dw_53]